MLNHLDANTRRALLWIIGACFIAHIWCLGSQFYLDDMAQIRDNEHVRNLSFWQTRVDAWTYLWYGLQAKLWGLSPVGFHAVNWLLHTASACVLYVSGRDYLRGRAAEDVAWFGALLFAVHPLASEIPNYARTQDLAWVTLLSLLAAWCLFRALHGGTWKSLLGCLLCIVGASFSKGPGCLHATLMTSVIGLAFLKPEHWRIVRKNAWLGCLVALLGLLVLWQTGLLGQLAQWSEPRVIGHAYTICRVFWEFGWRSVLPIQLSADHHIAETLVPRGIYLGIADTTALWAAAGVLVFTLATLVLAWRKTTRIIGVCFFLYVATMLMRMLYLIPEFMPEYRIYPGLPWFCLGSAILLAGAWRGICRRSPRIPAALLIGVLASMSAQRAFLYHDLNDLMADVLRQYPSQARAIWILQRNDFEAGRWQQVITRHQQQLPLAKREFLRENRRLAPRRELPSGHFALTEVGCGGLYAQAIAKQISPAAGLREINSLEAYMHALRIDLKANAIHWSIFHHAKGMVLETAGNYPAAIEFLAMDGTPSADRKTDLERVEAKLRTCRQGDD
ncbi:MAG: hypothetical protein DVB26_00790 [Verrucomicrobia bacterium]|nr:MAG: hypothetical protein DVB26_00790 [Verrucomicrobiota bacterium]